MSAGREQEESLKLRKARGAFFTPPPIADHLAAWAVEDNPEAKVLDPTCGEAVFLLAAGHRLRSLGRSAADMSGQLYGIDLHQASLDAAGELLEADGLNAHLLARDFFTLPTPQQLGCPLPEMDAVIGNPPFVRYQHHTGQARKASASAALAQGVRLSGLASSWAATVVHACSFLKPEGRLAMVLPAELLTVHYAEPVRRWLRNRFAVVYLVLFERLQFNDALEKVVLVLAKGYGGCESFSLFHVDDAIDLSRLGPYSHFPATPAGEGKWTDLLLPLRQRQLYKQVTREHCIRLSSYGIPELGTVTGSNDYFTMSEEKRQRFGLLDTQIRRLCPPGSRHLKGLAFTNKDWRDLRDAGEAVWLLYPDPNDDSPELKRYLDYGMERGVHLAYKCQVRTPWWRPPMVPPPDLFFTYMSHRFPRLISNATGRQGVHTPTDQQPVTFVNSMHGIRLGPSVPKVARLALPLLALNSVTLLGAELHGRSYGGGVLKMEPREAASLPVPSPDILEEAWARLSSRERENLNQDLRLGLWTHVVKRVDQVLLRDTMKLSTEHVGEFYAAAEALRQQRVGKRVATTFYDS